MLPSWHNRLYIAISPVRLSLIKLGRGLQPSIQMKHDEEIAPQDGQSWQAVLARCAQLLSQPEWQDNKVNMILSNRLFHFFTIQNQPHLNSYSVKEAYARHGLGQVYGAVAEKWALRIHQGEKGKADLVSAVEQLLLDRLRQVCDANKLSLRMVTPFFSSAFNYFLKRIEDYPSWLVIHEPGYSLIGLISGSSLLSLNGIYHDDIAELPKLLDRENLSSTLQEPCKSVYLFAPATKGLYKIAKAGYEIKQLDLIAPEGFPNPNEGAYAMVMSEFL